MNKNAGYRTRGRYNDRSLATREPPAACFGARVPRWGRKRGQGISHTSAVGSGVQTVNAYATFQRYSAYNSALSATRDGQDISALGLWKIKHKFIN